MVVKKTKKILRKDKSTYKKNKTIIKHINRSREKNKTKILAGGANDVVKTPHTHPGKVKKTKLQKQHEALDTSKLKGIYHQHIKQNIKPNINLDLSSQIEELHKIHGADKDKNKLYKNIKEKLREQQINKTHVKNLALALSFNKTFIEEPIYQNLLNPTSHKNNNPEPYSVYSIPNEKKENKYSIVNTQQAAINRFIRAMNHNPPKPYNLPILNSTVPKKNFSSYNSSNSIIKNPVYDFATPTPNDIKKVNTDNTLGFNKFNSNLYDTEAVNNYYESIDENLYDTPAVENPYDTPAIIVKEPPPLPKRNHTHSIFIAPHPSSLSSINATGYLIPNKNSTYGFGKPTTNSKGYLIPNPGGESTTNTGGRYNIALQPEDPYQGFYSTTNGNHEEGPYATYIIPPKK